MKKELSAFLGIGVTTVFFLTLLGMSACAPTMEGTMEKTAMAPKGPMMVKSVRKVTISPSPVEYKRRVKVLIAGSGFKPKQELGIRVVMGGVLSDISFLVKPRPVVNKFGAFSSVWTLNREIRRKLVKANTAYTVTVVDEDGNTLGTAPLVFEKAKKKGKKKK